MYQEIINCDDWKKKRNGKKLCKNANARQPLAMAIPDLCRVVIVSQAPSKPASEKQILADINNGTFNQFINVLGLSIDRFHKNVYWTHYGKCYPGSRPGGDQWPTVHCANKFIKREIAKCKAKGAKLVIGIAEPATKYLYHEFVAPETTKSSLIYNKIINKKHISKGLTWLFIKHTATTAAWSKDSIDKEFIERVLQPEVGLAVED